MARTGEPIIHAVWIGCALLALCMGCLVYRYCVAEPRRRRRWEERERREREEGPDDAITEEEMALLHVEQTERNKKSEIDKLRQRLEREEQDLLRTERTKIALTARVATARSGGGTTRRSTSRKKPNTWRHEGFGDGSDDGGDDDSDGGAAGAPDAVHDPLLGGKTKLKRSKMDVDREKQYDKRGRELYGLAWDHGVDGGAPLRELFALKPEEVRMLMEDAHARLTAAAKATGAPVPAPLAQPRLDISSDSGVDTDDTDWSGDLWPSGMTPRPGGASTAPRSARSARRGSRHKGASGGKPVVPKLGLAKLGIGGGEAVPQKETRGARRRPSQKGGSGERAGRGRREGAEEPEGHGKKRTGKKKAKSARERRERKHKRRASRDAGTPGSDGEGGHDGRDPPAGPSGPALVGAAVPLPRPPAAPSRTPPRHPGPPRPMMGPPRVSPPRPPFPMRPRAGSHYSIDVSGSSSGESGPSPAPYSISTHPAHARGPQHVAVPVLPPRR